MLNIFVLTNLETNLLINQLKRNFRSKTSTISRHREKKNELKLSQTLWVFSSVGLERYLDRVEVTGSNPVTPTKVPEVSGAFYFSISELFVKKWICISIGYAISFSCTYFTYVNYMIENHWYFFSFMTWSISITSFFQSCLSVVISQIQTALI